MNSKLTKYAMKSSIMDVSIQYGGDKIRFNLYEELVVNENKINTELKEHPTHYSFLSMLQTKMARLKDDAETELNKKRAELYLEFKSELNPNTNREYSNELVEMMVIDHDDYQEKLKAFNKVNDSLRVITSCVKAFEQRKDLIQSLAANIRNQ